MARLLLAHEVDSELSDIRSRFVETSIFAFFKYSFSINFLFFKSCHFVVSSESVAAKQLYCKNLRFDSQFLRKMERVLIGNAPKVKVTVLAFDTRFKKCSRSVNLKLGIFERSRNGVIPLRCFKTDDESLFTSISNMFDKDHITNSTEVIEWETGSSLDNILENQGIIIRRRPPFWGPSEVPLKNERSTPRNILEKIIWDKEVEVALLKEKKPVELIIEELHHAPPVRDFIGALKASHERTGMPALIAEVKKASPSRGVLREDFDPVQIACTYEKNGAACLSILTDEKYFQGSFENLEAVRKAGVKCPLLCKEFIIDSWQVYYARSKGADAILLIAAVLPNIDIKYLNELCQELGLIALVEVHNEREMDRVLGISGIHLIGINNRNLETFEVDISNTKKLLQGERGHIIRQKGITVVGESGLFTPEDIAFVQNAGVNAVLVGEALVRQDDPGKGIVQLFGKALPF